MVTPRQLAPSVGRTRAGFTVSAAPIYVNNGDDSPSRINARLLDINNLCRQHRLQSPSTMAAKSHLAVPSTSTRSSSSTAAAAAFRARSSRDPIYVMAGDFNSRGGGVPRVGAIQSNRSDASRDSKSRRLNIIIYSNRRFHRHGSPALPRRKLRVCVGSCMRVHRQPDRIRVG